MGERAQIKFENSGVYLYTHWGAGDIVDTLICAMRSPEGKSRWDDEEYLARIVFDTMVGSEQGSETGFGIGTTEHGDLDFPPLVVDCRKQTVTYPPEYIPVPFAAFIEYE